MIALTKDLFPETLLVNIKDGRSYTTSLLVAEHFHKRHDHVVRDIEKLIKKLEAAQISLPNFGKSDYTNARGKTYKSYEMDRDAFVLLGMGYTGAKVLQWKIDFIDAFNAMEQYIHLQQQRRAAALQRIRPHWITIEQADRAGLSRAEIAKLTGHKSLASITANRARMRQVGLPCRPLPQRKADTTH